MNEKPITVRIADFRRDLVAAMNGCGLPAWLQLYELRPLVSQLEGLAAAQMEEDMKKWQEGQKNGD